MTTTKSVPFTEDECFAFYKKHSGLEPHSVSIYKAEGSDFARLIDHGIGVARVCLLSDVLGDVVDGVEFGIFSRTYLDSAGIKRLTQKGGSLHGMTVVELPMPKDFGTWVLSFPGRGAAPSKALNAFCNALLNLQAGEFSYVLPQYLGGSLLVSLADGECFVGARV